MSRTIDAATKTALAGDNFNLATLIQLDFPTAIKITDWQRNITIGANTFSSSPDLTTTSSISESGELRVNGISIDFGGESQVYVALFLNGNYIDIQGRIWKAVLDSSDTVIGQPILIFDGRITSYAISDNDSSSKVGVELASHWKDFELVKGRLTNTNSQNLYFPNDTGFDYAHETRKDIKWGK